VAELGGVGLAEDDGAGRLQPAHGDVVLLRDQVREEPRAAGGAHAAGVEHVLQRHRYAVQRAERLALHDRDLRLAGRRPRQLRRHQAEGVHPRVERLDAGQQRGGELDGGELLVTNQRGDLERRSPGEILVDHGLRLRIRKIVSSGA